MSSSSGLDLARLERVVMGSVSITARAVAEAAPELSLLQWRVLVVLADAPAGATVTELATRIGSRLPATSRLLGRLRGHGLVEATKDRLDGRVTIASLTPDGRALYARVVERRRADLSSVLDAIGIEPAEGAVLERLAASLGAYL